MPTIRYVLRNAIWRNSLHFLRIYARNFKLNYAKLWLWYNCDTVFYKDNEARFLKNFTGPYKKKV